MSADTWEEASLGSRLLRIETGRSPSLTDSPASPGQWGVLKVSAVHSLGYRPSENKAVDDPGLINERFAVKPGDLLFSRANTPELVGSACIATPSQERLMLSDKTLRLVVDQRTADMQFVNLSLASPAVRKQITVAASGSSLSMQNISQAAVERLRVAWPPLADQQRIVEALAAFAEAERALEVSISKLRILRRGAHLSLMSAVDAHGVASKSWSRVPLKDVVPSTEYGISEALVNDPSGVPVLRMNNLQNGRPDVTDLRYCPVSIPQRLYLKRGEVLFNRTNSIDHVGKAALWREELPTASFASYLVRLNPDSEKLLPEYLVEWLQHPVIRQRVRAISTVAVQQVNVNPTRLRELEIDFPSDLAEQRRIVSTLASFDDRIDREVEELAKLRRLKRGLTGDLLSGRVRVPEVA
jgi:type I restriction enzyme S subunit